MNVLTIFDQRITAIFEKGAPGERLPFSFKRLAKRAVREMEDETFVIDGVDTAPALYTILVSQTDDLLMHPLYVQITDEMSQLIEAQAKKRGYTFVGRPLVRFMVDPGLRAGRFSVFAENIDPRTLARLRDEENAYLGINPPQSPFGGQSFVPASIPVHEEEPTPIAQEVAFEADAAEPLGHPEPFISALDDLPDAAANVQAAEPDPFDLIPKDYMAEVAEDAGAAAAQEAPHASHLSEPTPATKPEPLHASAPEPVQTAPKEEPACTLIDLGSGRTYRITTWQASIGRERVTGGVVLTDPNASRRHAELVFDGSAWSVRDLNSTNGTLVNDVDVPEARLHDGDVLTIGLTNLEFRAG